MRQMIAGLPLILILAAACGFTSPGTQEKAVHTISVLSFPEMTPLGDYAVGEDNRFSLSFIHSVSETPVIDHYVIENEEIIQTSEVFMTHEAGLPSAVEDPTATGWEHEDGKFILRLRRPITRLIVRTDSRYRNRLITGGKTIDLNQWEDQALLIRVRLFSP